MQTFARVLLWISGLGMLGFGLAFLWAPLATMAAAGLVLEGALASTELRAFYGGLEVALGLLMIACAMRPGRLRDGLILSLSIYGSIALRAGDGAGSRAGRRDRAARNPSLARNAFRTAL